MENKRLLYQAATNENLFGSSPQVLAAMQQALNSVHGYPTPDAADLRHALAGKLGVQANEIVIGSGSAELISLLVRRFCGHDRESEVLTFTPSYPLYCHEAQALRISCTEIPLTSSYQVDVQALRRQLRPTTRLCFICNPNNPTGTYLTSTALEEVLDCLPAHVTTVVDEAYIEYATATDCADAVAMLARYPNLVVLRTFSKAYGLASVRIGYMVAQRHLIEQVLEVKQPYNVNQLAQVAALAALEDEHFLEMTVEATQTGKAKLEKALLKMGVQFWPSQGNFLLLDAGGYSADDIHNYLLANNILVRRADQHTLRLTIGPDEHQLYLLHMLQELLHPSRVYADQPLLAKVLDLGHQLQEEPEEAAAQLHTLLHQAAEQPNADGRIAQAFARALILRSQQDKQAAAGNLYATNFGEMDMIAAFNVLVTATPLVTFGHRFANHSILSAMAGKPAVYLLDLGIGSGLQWFHFMDLVASLPGERPKFHLTGIDIPDSSNADPAYKLRATGERLAAHAARLGLDFSYTYVATRLEDFDLQTLEIDSCYTLVVNAALTLHHLADELVAIPDQRDRVLQQIRALRPQLITLTEPDSEHNRLEFLPRLRESLRHYHTVFDVLDTLLPADMPERRVIEQEFFGREILNVVAFEGIDRVERHERQDAWQHRLLRNGFKPAPCQVTAAQIKQELDLHPQFSLAAHTAGYTLHWKGTNIIAATAWQVAD
ncbi:histidinol-phosphate transaminase [Pontibacter ramchanderi]|uniref:Histidinol-phosphate aminotransferase n=1 Tax=Pontibacter ramchanderi TaxID=1179743 RepID=A0A2N3U8V4_9BACT|nr:histidinol-phosphate transaminase [Pontibacter ramchanderi]PKV63181.1 histidinol-phosphate aminotransferase [Pontibacter ramchanderi]